jgi:Ca2+-binding RTX toxin-like protein
VTDVEGLASLPLDLALVTVAQQAVIGDALYVGGTNGSDRIIVGANGTVRFNSKLLPNVWPGGRLVVLGNGGNDTITSSSVRFPIEYYGGAGNDYLAGGASDDLLDGGDGNDRLLGADGHDILLGGSGNDQFGGGNGDDYALGDDMFDPVDGELTLFIFADAGFEVELPIRLADQPGRDNVRGDNGNDTLYGGPMNDTLYGGNGNDLLRGGAGNDRLDGGNQDDLLLGEGDADTLYGRAGNDILIGGAGTDSLYGYNGEDLLFGGSIFEGNTDEDVQELWMLWRNFAQDEAIDELLAIGEDDEISDTLHGEKGADWYLLFARDRLRISSEFNSPNEIREF